MSFSSDNRGQQLYVLSRVTGLLTYLVPMDSGYLFHFLFNKIIIITPPESELQRFRFMRIIYKNPIIFQPGYHIAVNKLKSISELNKQLHHEAELSLKVMYVGHDGKYCQIIIFYKSNSITKAFSMAKYTLPLQLSFLNGNKFHNRLKCFI